MTSGLFGEPKCNAHTKWAHVCLNIPLIYEDGVYLINSYKMFIFLVEKTKKRNSKFGLLVHNYIECVNHFFQINIIR